MGQAELLRDEAMERVEANADAQWYRSATIALYMVIKRLDRFTSDDVWAMLDSMAVPAPREPRALGPIINRAIREGDIVNVGYQKSTRGACHARPVAVYESVRND